MLTFVDKLSQSQIQQFKTFWIDNQNRTYVNWEINGQVLDRRLLISPKDALWSTVEKIVRSHIPNPKNIWCALQRQNFAHQIHIDDFGSDTPGYRYTFVFSLDTMPKFKTFVWKERCWDNSALHNFVSQWGHTRLSTEKKSNISASQDLEHTYDENQNDYLCDYLELDGVYSYKAGDGVLFHADQLHCTSNWIKYPEIPHRDLLQIHVGTDHYLDI